MKNKLEEDGCILAEPVNGEAKSNSEDDLVPTLIRNKDLNPFVHKLPLDSAYDRFKLIFMSVFVLPFRVFMIIICLLMAYALSMTGMFMISREELAAKPLSGWRRKIRWWMGLVGRTMMRCYGFHWVGIKGRLASRAEAPILVVGPHSSFLDCVAVFWSKVPGLVNRIENLQLPFFGRYIDYTQPVYVWREDPNSRQNTILEIKRRVNSEDEWPQIMIFPEGTCTNRSCLITYKQGAFYPGVPVQPVVLRYPNKTDSITWTWDGPGAVKMLWVTLCQFHNYCEIEYLPVYNPSQAEIDDPWLYARNVRQVMADALDVPVVDYTYDDCRIMHKAQLKNLPCATGLIEFQKLRQTYTNLNLKEVEGVLMDAFAAMALSGAEVSLSDLSAYLRIPSSESTLAQLFNHYDKDGRGTISFRDFVIYRSQFASEATSEKTVKWAFELFDRGGEGRLSLEAFAKALQAAIGLPEGPASEIFKEVDAEANGYLTYDDFLAYAKRKPEYAQMFLFYQKSLKEGSRAKVTAAPDINKEKTQ